MSSRHGEILEVPTDDGEVRRFRIIEKPVDPPNTIKRELVPADTDPQDIPEGSRMLDERETDGFLARASKPDNILVGDTVRLKVPTGEVPTEKQMIKGTVDAKLVSGKFRVKWEDGSKDTYDIPQLAKVW